MWDGMRVRCVIGLVTLLVVGGLTVGDAGAQPAAKNKPTDPPAASGADSRAADRAAIAARRESFSKAFESRDAEALAAHWTSDGEYENEAGVAVQGRGELAKAFAAFFAKTPEVQAELHPESLKFVGQDTALSEGTVVVRQGLAQSATRARYSALLVREEGRWQLAKYAETASPEPALDDLSWLIGEWKSSRGEGAEIRTVYTWSANKKFIYVDFTLQEQGLSLSGKQVIGIDPATRQIRSWTFEADGGVGVGDWSRDGDHWVITATGTLADGRSLNETNVLRRVSADVVTWQSVNRQLADNDFPDLPPVKVARVKAQK